MRCRITALITALFISLSLLLLLTLFPNKIHAPKSNIIIDDTPQVLKSIKPEPIPKNVLPDSRKIIYVASGFFGDTFRFNDLPQQCRLSYDAADFKTADAVIFHALPFDQLLNNALMSEGGRRSSGVSTNQVWVGIMYESPAIYPELTGLLNYTMTFRRDSDIYSPYAGRFEKAEKSKSLATREPLLENFRTSGNRTKKVAWMVSNCFTLNKRLEYAIELSKHIDVDIYGLCSPNKLSCQRFGGAKPSDRDCWEMVARDYKFYLSFESSHCKDYITEKFIYPMYYGVLPIVYGGASKNDYEAIAPKHSFIDTRDFNSPKDLADFLHHLDKSPEAYNRYFEWRTRYNLDYQRGFIGQDILCSKLWNLDKHRRSYSPQELDKWWRVDGNCIENPWTPQTV